MKLSHREFAIAVVVLTSACASDTSNSRRGDAGAQQSVAEQSDAGQSDAQQSGAEQSGADGGGKVPDVSSMHDAGSNVDASPQDGDGERRPTDAATEVEVEATDAGAAAEPAPTPTFGPAEGIAIGNFTNGDPAFDGLLDQPAAESANTPLYLAVAEDIWLGKNWRCSARLSSVVVHGPSDGAFTEDGSQASVAVLGRNDVDNLWNLIAEKPLGSQNPAAPVEFGPEDLDSAPPYTVHALGFPKTAGSTTTLRIAEAEMEATCVEPMATIQWETSDWQCDAECEQVDNPGERSRSVSCLRNGQTPANEALCGDNKPAAEGGSCGLACGFSLVFLGYREFTYQNSSGWLHEGRADSRAGPLPRAVEFGNSPEAIEGSPCSIETTTPSTYFVGISCENPDTSSEQEYCAFRCE